MSESVENFCLRWNDFGSNISQSFHELRQDSDFFDVTLATSDSGERTLRAHKVILSACSTFFKALLKKQAILNPNNMPLIYLRGVTYNDLSALLDFMYQGEVNVGREDLDSFLAVGEELEVKGLTPKDREKHLSNHSDLLNSTFQKAKKGPVTDRLQNFNLGKWNAKVEPRDMNYGVEKGFRPDSNSLESNDEAVVNEAFEGYCSDFYNDDEGTDNRRESFNTPDKGETWLITPDIDVVTESVFPCPHCEYTSSKKQNLKSHINAVHKGHRTLYKCHICSAKFTQSMTLRNHLRGVHEKIKSFECKYCDYKCAYSSNLSKHIRVVHERQKLFSCDFCSYKCSQKSSLTKHIGDKHQPQLASDS